MKNPARWPGMDKLRHLYGGGPLLGLEALSPWAELINLRNANFLAPSRAQLLICTLLSLVLFVRPGDALNGLFKDGPDAYRLAGAGLKNYGREWDNGFMERLHAWCYFSKKSRRNSESVKSVYIISMNLQAKSNGILMRLR